MSQAPENTVVRPEYDASMMGLYASLVAGGLMLAYAIWYVTVVNVDNDYSFLTLGHHRSHCGICDRLTRVDEESGWPRQAGEPD